VIRHVFWDWNGTLLADTALSARAIEASLAALGFAIPVTTRRWREVADRPIEGSFIALIGHDLAPEQWIQVEDAFLRTYLAGVGEAGLTDGAVAALTRLHEAGPSQSLLSLHPEDALRADVARAGVAAFFDAITGRPPVGSHDAFPDKAALIADEADRRGLSTADTVMIGDMVDDAASARRAGAQAVLVATGDTLRERLVASGFPVRDTLAEAVDWVLGSGLA